MIHRINYDTNVVERFEITNSTQYVQVSSVCDTDIDLTWINKRGGFDRFVFKGKHSYSSNVSAGVLYFNDNGERKFASRGEVYRKILVYSGYISIDDAIALRSLKESIQIFYNGLSYYINEGEFAEYKVGTTEITVSFTLTLSKKVFIQTQ